MNSILRAMIILSLAVLARAQDDAPTEAERTPDQIVAEAVTALAREKSAAFEGTADELEPDAGMGGGVVVMGGGPGAASEPFTGKFHVLRAGNETVIASKRKLPGLVSFDDGDRTLVRTTYEDAPIDASRLTGELPQLLDLDRLASAISRSKSVKPIATGNDGETRYVVELSRKFIAGASGPMAMMSPRILSLTASVTLDPGGRVTALLFSILRSDPMAPMRRRAMKGDFDGGSSIALGGADDDDPEPGDTTVFELKRITGNEPASLRALASELRELLK